MVPHESGPEEEAENLISGSAIQASIEFVELCCQQTMFMAGRGFIKDDIEVIRASKYGCGLCTSFCNAMVQDFICTKL